MILNYSCQIASGYKKNNSRFYIVVIVYTFAIYFNKLIVPDNFTPSYFCLLYSTSLHFTSLHCTPLHSIPLYFTLVHFTPFYLASLYSTALHFTSLHTPPHFTSRQSTPQSSNFTSPSFTPFHFAPVDVYVRDMLSSGEALNYLSLAGKRRCQPSPSRPK